MKNLKPDSQCMIADAYPNASEDAAWVGQLGGAVGWGGWVGQL